MTATTWYRGPIFKRIHDQRYLVYVYTYICLYILYTIKAKTLCKGVCYIFVCAVYRPDVKYIPRIYRSAKFGWNHIQISNVLLLNFSNFGLTFTFFGVGNVLKSNLYNLCKIVHLMLCFPFVNYVLFVCYVFSAVQKLFFALTFLLLVFVPCLLFSS